MEDFLAPYTFTRDEYSFYLLKERFESLTDETFQSLEELYDERKAIEEAIAEDDRYLDEIKACILEASEHKKLMQTYLSETLELIKEMASRLPAVPSLMVVKDYTMVQIGEHAWEKSRHIVYRLFSFYYDKDGKVVASKLLKDSIAPTELKAIVDEYLESGKVSKIEYFDGLRTEKKTCEKWVRKYIEEQKLIEVK